MKKFTAKQIEWIRFSIYIVGTAVMYGINLAFHADFFNRWVALALTIVVTGLTFWSARSKYWQGRLKEDTAK